MSKKTFLQGKYTVTVESKESDAGSWSSAIGITKDGADVPVHLPGSGQSAWQTDAEAISAGIAQGLVCVNRDNESASD
jgi:ribosomal protein S9